MRLKFHLIGILLALIICGLPLLIIYWVLILNADGPKLQLAHNNPAWIVSYSPDGERIATASECEIFIWNAHNGKKLNHFSGCSDGEDLEISSISFSPDRASFVITYNDENAISLNDENAWIMNAETGEGIAALRGHMDSVFGAFFSPDGRFIATFSLDHTLRLWNASSFQELFRFKAADGYIISNVAFSPDSRFIADDGGHIYNTATGIELPELIGFLGATSVQFNETDTVLYSGSNDGLVRAWNVQSGTEIQQYIFAGEWIPFIFYDSVHHRVIAVESYGKIRIWDASTGQLVDNIHTRAGDIVVGAAISPDFSSIALGYDGFSTTIDIWSLEDK